MKRLARPVFALSLVLVASCGQGKVGDGVRPKDITAQAALGAPAPVCTGEPKLAKPYVFDLDESIRVDLEAGMSKGVVVVSYDCSSLRVLSNCRLADGRYEYAGVQPKDKVVQVTNQDDLTATIPFSSGKLGGEVKSGRSIDLALVLVGLKSTAVYKIKRDELTGDCEGATHFIQSAEVGAFAMATGSAGRVAAAAELFSIGASGSSESSRNVKSRDGSIDSCKKSDPDAPKPPSDCRAPLTVQLKPLLGQPKPDEKAEKPPSRDAMLPIENPCREGYLFADGICTKAADKPHLCHPRNVDDCLAQCEKGSAESCYNYAAYVGHDFSIRKKYSKKACDGGFPDGCGDYAIFDKLEAKGDPPTSPRRMAGLKITEQGCDAGGGKSCFILGKLLWGYNDDSMKDLNGGRRAWERSCALGYGRGCSELSMFYQFGTSDDRVAKDMKRAIEYQQLACENDSYLECFRVAELLVEAEPPLRDVERAVRVLRTDCTNMLMDCDRHVELLTKLNRPADAFAMAKVACDRSTFACDTLGDLYNEGRGTPRDPAKAREAWTRGCDGGKGDDESCKRLSSGAKKAVPAKKAAPKRKKK